MAETKKYKVICCNCNKEIYATKSIFHKMGMFDLGQGRCLHCNTSLQLIYEPETDTMKSRLYDDFIKEMNQKAFILGMYNTTFENPHGLNDHTKNYSTAYDLAILMKYAIKNDDFLKISQTLKYKIKNYIWYNKNELLANYKYAISGKIGFTKKSGPVFVSSARKNNKTLVIATINEPDKFNLHKSLYEDFFKKYSRYKVLDSNKISSKLRQKNNTHYYIKNDYFMLLQKNEFKKVDVIFYKNRQNAYINVYYDNDLIHTEKVCKLDYKKRINKIKDILFFWK